MEYIATTINQLVPVTPPVLKSYWFIFVKKHCKCCQIGPSGLTDSITDRQCISVTVFHRIVYEVNVLHALVMYRRYCLFISVLLSLIVRGSMEDSGLIITDLQQ